MRFLLDTHTLLWWLGDPDRLSADARVAIRDGSNDVFVSAVSAWEIAIKKRVGRLEAPDDLETQIDKNRFMPLPIGFSHALAIEHLPGIHRDPFDRLLVVQARLETLTIVTRDDIIPKYGVSVLMA